MTIAPKSSSRFGSGTYTQPALNLMGAIGVQRVAEPYSNGRLGERPFVLVVDDDIAIRQALEMVMTDQGLRCLGLPDGQRALDFLRSPEPLPDLIMLDVMMPIMNGWEFRRAQLMDPVLAAVPTILLTAATETAHYLAEFRIQEMLRKPVDLDTLFAAIERNIPDWTPEA